jgi:hypothetical protein
MKAKLIFLAGAATGFVLGSKAGRGAYDKLKAKATETLEDPKVKKGLETASEFVSSQAPVVGHKLQDAASTVAGKVTKKSKDTDQKDTDDKNTDASESSTDSADSSSAGDSSNGADSSSGADHGDAHGPMTPATPAP